MHVFTYYDESVGHPGQLQLIELWKRSWSEMGFTPVVLTRSHAEDHSYFKEYTSQIDQIHKKIMYGIPVRKYGLSCYHRWLAYAKHGSLHCCSLTCDYDVINLSLSVDEARKHLEKYGKKVVFHHGTTPCLVSGQRDLFEFFCKEIVRISNKNINLLKNTVHPHYNDQEFVQFNRSDLLLGPNQNKFQMDTSLAHERIIGDYEHTLHDLSKKLIHFSHYFCDQARIKLNKSEMPIDDVRIKIVSKILDFDKNFFNCL